MKSRTDQRNHLLPRQSIEHRTRSLLLLIAALVVPLHLQAQRVVFVDAGRAGGAGTWEKPFATIREAQAAAGTRDVIYVAEASVPYEESVALARGQMLVGSAFGLDALREELHVPLEAPAVPSSGGAGPVIHGSIALAGENVVAGLTIDADPTTGAALTAESPQGPLAIRRVWIRTSGDVFGLYVGNSAFPMTWTGGGLTGANHGSGILITGGQSDVTLDGVPVSGSFATGIAVSNRAGGPVVFRNKSAVHMDDVSRAGVSVRNCRGAVRFESPLQVKTSGGRGLAIDGSANFSAIGGDSWVEAANATAIDIRDSATDVVLHHVSAGASPPGRLTEGIVLDRIHGRFEIHGGAIADAAAYAIRVTQSSDVRIHDVAIAGGGTMAGDCPEDVRNLTNVRCRAALYLRHVERSQFDGITIERNAGVGLNANNIADVGFSGIRISGTGDQAEPGVLIDEARGDVTFAHCSIADASGGGVAVEQRFSSARIAFDDCDISAPDRPVAAEALMRVEVEGGRLAVQLSNVRLHDNAASAVRVAARSTGSVDLDIRNSRFERFGSLPISVSASGTAGASIRMHDTVITAPAVREPLVAVRLADRATACFEGSRNEFTGGASPQVSIASDVRSGCGSEP